MNSFKIKVNPTPWDRKIFGLDTYEIILPVFDKSNAEDAQAELNQLTKVNHPAIFYSRINANLSINKLVLFNAGFINCETQLHITKNIKNFEAPTELGTRRLQIILASERDYKDVVEQSVEVFKFSRFHEDPYIDTNLANLRMKNWAEDMKKNNTPLIVSRNRLNELESFIFYKKVDSKSVELILGGSMPGKGMLTPLFWVSFLEYFKGMGIERVETKISASNIVIFNIYLFFNFQIKSVFFDFHKHFRL